MSVCASRPNAEQAAPQPQEPAPPPLPAERQEGPLSPEQLQAVGDARRRAARIRTAGGVALFNGCTIGFFAATAALFALISPLFGHLDVKALVMTVGLGAVAWNELRGRKLLLRYEPRAPRVLGWNQVGLLALIVGYCLWQLAEAAWGPNPYAEQIAATPELGGMLGDISALHRKLTYIAYTAVIAGTVIFQGLNALYYFTRARHLRAFLHETPAWVVELQRHAAT